MKEHKLEPKTPSVAVASITLLIVCAVILFGLRAGIGAQMSLFLGAVVSIVSGLLLRVQWGSIQSAILRVLSDSLIPILILMIVGIMVGAWIIGGTVPSLMYYGLKLCTPVIILPLTFVLCAVMSVFTGTSFGSIATMGLALLGVAIGMGIPIPVTVGAIISGSYFGDKLSPMSDSTNLASAMTGADLYEHIGSMMYTTIPATAICLILYTIIGFEYGSGNLETGTIDLMTATLDSTFNISIFAIIPAIMMLVVSVKKVPAILGLTGCALFSVVFAMILQPVGFKEVMSAAFSGYSSQTGVALVDTILSRGGLASMMNTIALVMIAGIMGGALNASGVLTVFVDQVLMKLIKSTRSLVMTTMAYSCLILLMSGSQPLGVVMGGPTFKPAYEKMDLHYKVLSRALADTTTVMAPLVPWSTAAAYTMGVLGVGLDYVPYAFLCYIVPIFTIISAFTGIGMWRFDGTRCWGRDRNYVKN